MFQKLFFLTLVLVVLGGALLLLRQQRIEIAHRNAVLYQQIQKTRQNIWDAQHRAAIHLRNKPLQRRIMIANLPLEPADTAQPIGPSGTYVLTDDMTVSGAFR